MYSKTDIFFIILFVIVISIIIGLNIVNVIDKKINNVSVNIPPINIPKTNIILTVDKKKTGEITIGACSTTDTKNANIDNKEHFIVSDAQQVPDYRDLKDEYLQKPNNFDDAKLDDIDKPEQPNDANITSGKEEPNSKCSIQYDKEQDKIDKDKTFSLMVSNDSPMEKFRKDKLEKAYITSADFGWDAPNHYVSCANSSIAEQYKTGKKSLLPNKITCGYPNKLTSENYYKTHYKKQIVPIEDYLVRGYNYTDYSDFPTPYQVTNMRILSQNTKGLPPEQTKTKNIPLGYNFAFHNTPAMPMP